MITFQALVGLLLVSNILAYFLIVLFHGLPDFFHRLNGDKRLKTRIDFE
jgi:hypothetical protein